MTVLLGPTPCIGCRTPVTVVRRPVVFRGHLADCGAGHPPCVEAPSTILREVVVTSLHGIEHLCYPVGAEYSGASDIMHTATRPARRLYSDAAGRVLSGVQTE
jgi:hypothetical protein